MRFFCSALEEANELSDYELRSVAGSLQPSLSYTSTANAMSRAVSTG